MRTDEQSARTHRQGALMAAGVLRVAYPRRLHTERELRCRESAGAEINRCKETREAERWAWKWPDWLRAKRERGCGSLAAREGPRADQPSAVSPAHYERRTFRI